MDKNDMQKKVREEQDFIHAPKYQNSINKYVSKMDAPLENGAIARILLISEEEVDTIYLESVEALKKEMLHGDKEGSD